MELISTEEKILLLKNILEDPDDEISREIICLTYDHEAKILECNTVVITDYSDYAQSKS